MRKANDILILIAGIFLFLAAYILDQQVNVFFNNFRYAFFDAIFSIITNFGVLILVMLAMPSIALYKKSNNKVYLLLTVFIASIILAFAIKWIVLRQRPIEAFAYPFISIISYSFPSMHAMAAFALLPALVEFLPMQKNFWLSFAFLVGFTRVYFSFHFLSDVVFGGLFGYFLGNWLLELFKKGKLWK